MSNNNELIEAINASQAGGFGVKSIRKQKYDPCSFYMTRSDNKQIGPVRCEGSMEDLDRKFSEAQAYLFSAKSGKRAA